jgi:hypothetical protein
MELPDLLRFVGPQWTTEHTRKALLHLHDEGEIIFRQHFPCVLLDPTWFCSTVIGRILSGLHPPIRNARTDLMPAPSTGAEQYSIRKTSCVPKDHLTIAEISKICKISPAQGSFVAELLEGFWFCAKEADGRYLFPAMLHESSGDVLDHLDRHNGHVRIGRRIRCSSPDLFTPGLFPRLQLMLKALVPAAHCKLWRRGVQLVKNNAVARVESIVLDWSIGHPQAIDICVRASILDETMRLVSDVIRCTEIICEEYAPGVVLGELQAIVLQPSQSIKLDQNLRETVDIAELEKLQADGKITHWGVVPIVELLGQEAGEKPSFLADDDALREEQEQKERHLQYIKENGVLVDYYRLMKCQLQDYFKAVSVLCSGECKCYAGFAVSFTHNTAHKLLQVCSRQT